MRAHYHKFTGDVPVVFVEDAVKFIRSLGVEIREDRNKVTLDFMHEVTIAGIPMLVFHESLLRTMYGSKTTPVIEAHLALWKGMKRHPDNVLQAYKYAMALAERYNRTKCHEMLRRKLAETTNIVLPPLSPQATAKNRSIESILFAESDKVQLIEFKQLISEAITISDIKKKIVELIKSAEEDVIRKVFSFLSRDSGEYDKALGVLVSIGIPERYGRTILDQSLETGDFEDLAKYLQKRTLTLNALSSTNDFISAAKKAVPGLSDKFVSWLVNYQWPTTPSMGAGEAALIILLKDGNKPAKGDVAVGNRELEVKGDNGRLKGQHGYGLGEQAAKVFFDEFSKRMKKVPAEHRIPVPKPGGTEYNCTKTGKGGWAANDLARVCVAHGAATKADIISIWKKAIQAIQTKMPVNWIASYVTDTGEIHNATGFLKTWLAESATYYQKVEGFEAILLISRKGKFVVISPNDFDKLDTLVKWTPPNFSSRAGSQGAAFGITVK